MRRDCDQPKIDRVGPPVVCASVHDTQNRVPLEAGGEVLQRPTERITIFVSGKRPKFHLDRPIVVPMALVNSFDGICTIAICIGQLNPRSNPCMQIIQSSDSSRT